MRWGPLLNVLPGGKDTPRFENLSEEDQDKIKENCRVIGKEYGPANIRKIPIESRSRNGKRLSQRYSSANGKLTGAKNLLKVSKESRIENGRKAGKKYGLGNLEKAWEASRNKHLKSIEHVIPMIDTILNWRDVQGWTYQKIGVELKKRNIPMNMSVRYLIKSLRKIKVKKE